MDVMSRLMRLRGETRVDKGLRGRLRNIILIIFTSKTYKVEHSKNVDMGRIIPDSIFKV